MRECKFGNIILNKNKKYVNSNLKNLFKYTISCFDAFSISRIIWLKNGIFIFKSVLSKNKN